MVDDVVVELLLNPRFDPLPYVWAVDVDFDEGDNEGYPKGYTGSFKVAPSALLNGLYLALASGVMEPVEVWRLLGPRTGRVETRSEEKANHDEL